MKKYAKSQEPGRKIETANQYIASRGESPHNEKTRRHGLAGLPARLFSTGTKRSGVANSSTVTSLRWRSESGPGISVRAGNNSS